MTKSSVPKSLVRTTSSGEMNVFLVLKVKATMELIIVSRDELPPALRLGKLVLNQKVTFRDHNRQNIESSIIYMHTDRQVCVNAKNQFLQTKKQSEEIVEEDRTVETMKPSSITTACAALGNNPKQTKTPVSKSTKDSIRRSTVQRKLSARSINLLPSPPPQLVDITPEELNSIVDSTFETTIGSIQRDYVDVPFEEQTESIAMSMTVDDDNDNDYLIQEIQKLTLKVKDQCQMIKDRDSEIKRLKSTTISMPTDEAARDYILYVANRIQHSSNGFKYNGNLTVDAKRLGIPLDKLNESLNAKNLIATTARNLFKKMVPESERQVDHWNQLKADVLMKEKILLNFLERYYGPLEADRKKLHTSLVGCLRNQRSVQKKQNQKKSIDLNNGHELNLFEME